MGDKVGDKMGDIVRDKVENIVGDKVGDKVGHKLGDKARETKWATSWETNATHSGDKVSKTQCEAHPETCCEIQRETRRAETRSWERYRELVE